MSEVLPEPAIQTPTVTLLGCGFICLIPITHSTSFCSSFFGNGISMFPTISLEISLNVAPRPNEFKYSVLHVKNQYKYLGLIFSEQI